MHHEHASPRPASSEIRSDRYPMPAVPSGWYAVLRSHDLPVDKVVTLRYFGRELIAFRGAGGRAAVLDAYCPHYGAHLGVGGRVAGGEIECPFHGWRFGADGRCTHAPFAARTPRASVDAFPVREHSGLVFVYVGGHAPTWEVAAIPEASARRFAAPLSEVHRAKIHVQEMRENIVDESHFHFIHGQESPAAQVFKTDGPRATVSGRLRKRILGVDFDNAFEAEMYGPGVMVARTSGRFLTSTTIALTTPIDAETSEMRLLHYIARPSRFPFAHPLLKILFSRVAGPEVRAEVRIWDHKIHRARPILLPHEKGIRALRQWYSQFYESASRDLVPPSRLAQGPVSRA